MRLHLEQAANAKSVLNAVGLLIRYIEMPAKVVRANLLKQVPYLMQPKSANRMLYRAFYTSKPPPLTLKPNSFSSFTSNRAYAEESRLGENEGIVYRKAVKGTDILVDVGAVLGNKALPKLCDMPDMDELYSEVSGFFDDWTEAWDAIKSRKEYLVRDLPTYLSIVPGDVVLSTL